MSLSRLSTSILLLATAASLRAAITDGLVAYWTFDETNGMVLRDATTNANHGTLYNFPANSSQWVPGRVGGALNFRGPASGDHVRVPNCPKPSSALTIAAWVWAEARPPWATIVKNWPTEAAAQFHFGLQDTAGDLSNYLIQQGGVRIGPVQEGTALPLASWQHVALVCDGSMMRLYRNGALVGTPLNYNGTINTNCQFSLGIGAKLGTNGAPPTTADNGYWQGKIDDLGLWTRALSADEIVAIYGAGLEGRSLTNADSTFGGGAVAITEFMAGNSGFLLDQDGDSPDWIEIFNGTAAPVDLAGWSLTDNVGNLRKWLFPATNLAANSFLIVFASGKDRATAGAELHTSFDLRAGGEFLALVDPRTNIVSQFSPLFPPQVANVSYGLAKLAPPLSFVTNGSPLRYLVPTDDALGTNWVLPAFNESGWTRGTNAIGYETAAADYAGLFATDVQALMFERSPSCLIRIPFVVTNPTDFAEWKLRLLADDGVVIWLNGEEILRYFAPDALAWNAFATSNRVDTDVLVGETFSLTEFERLLVPGTNLLAIHALNARLDSSDLLISPQLEAKSVVQLAAAPRYFTLPTPGAPNVGGVEVLGPVLSDLAHTPAVPGDHEDLLVTIRARPAFGPITNLTLHFRVMFSNEVAAPMFDDGAHGDGGAGDGVFGASIPASAAQPGQMVRYFVTALDNAGRASRWPLFLDPFGSAEYLGTVARNSSLTTPLPVLQWFVQNPAAADTGTGTRCSIFFNDEFYDNVFVRVRGQTSRAYPKKSYKFEVNDEHHFLFRPDLPRVDEFDVNTTYTDKSYVRAVLAYEHKRDAGLPCPEVFHLRVQQNGQFFSVALFVEQPDRDFLRHRGLPDTGALYKATQGGMAENLSLYEKKTRKTESNADLQAFFSGLQLTGAALENFLFDHVEVAEVVNYMATVAVTQDIDASDKNHFFLCDTEGTRRWRILPWDIDLTFGPNALNTDVMVANLQDPATPACASHPFIGARPYMLHANKFNRLLEAIVNTPRAREMLLRRIRTLVDQSLVPGWFTNRIHALVPLLQADVDADRARWGGNAHFPGATYTLRQATDRIVNEYLTPRLPYLTSHGIVGVGTTNPLSQAPLVFLQFAGAEVNPASGVQDQEYLCLTNAHPFAVDVTGWKVRGDIEFEFAPGTVLPATNALYLSPNVVEFRARAAGPRGGLGLFVQGNYHGHLSARGGSVRLLNDYDREVASLGHLDASSLAQQFLRLTELMFHPVPPPPGTTNTAEDFEFIELRNVSPSVTLDLAGVRFIEGVQFNFNGSAVTNLAPGARVLVVANWAAFTNRYGPGLPVAGEYNGQFNNGGERLQLVDANGEEILDFSFDNTWHPITDGHGFSLVIVDDAAPAAAWDLPSSWRASGGLHGSPGDADPALQAIAPVRVSEVLSASLPAGTDAVELFNPTATNVDLSGWWLSDDFRTPKKFRLPDGSEISAGGFLVFNETEFNPAGLGFAFDPDGDDVWLFSADAAGELTGYAHGFNFGSAEPGVSFGLHVTNLGVEQFVAQSTNTLGTNNALPRVGPVVISEIMFHPPDRTPRAGVGPVDLGTDNSLDEFIELQNLAATNVALAGWRLRNAVDFDFPSNALLAAGARLLVVSFDPALDTNVLAGFRSTYRLGSDVALIGPWAGKLDNSADTLELRQPVLYGTNASHPLVERVRYRDSAPWPGADGDGTSLRRLSPTTFADDPANWTAAAPTPGADFTGGTRPALLAQPSDTTAVAYTAAAFSVSAEGTSPLRFQWRRNGANLDGATNATLAFAAVQPQQHGQYSVVVFNAAGSVTSTGALLNVLLPPFITQQPQNASVGVGSNVTFTVAALGTGPLHYQWRQNNVGLLDATNASLTLTNLQLTHSGAYTVVVTDEIGSATSPSAVLTVLGAPFITQQPSPAFQEALQGGTIMLTVAAVGTQPLSYKWRRNNITVLNQTNSLLRVTNAASANAGNYTVIITNLAGQVTSAPPAVVVVLADNDRDGMADNWERRYGFATNSVADATQDADGDGLLNWQEYVTGTDPTNTLSVLRLDVAEWSGGVVLGLQAVSNRSYSLQFLNVLGTTNWQRLADLPAQPASYFTNVLDERAAASRFYRVVTPQQP
ncbi:MAG: lamin tail domain-containing protein [Verrucomicrobia bacterium]|nr:lamin tail domain-containing protein [Verrucomicrobiota bacterium]